MSIENFEEWLQIHCPDNRTVEELIMRLAIGSAALVEDCANKTNMSVDEILEQFYWNDNQVITN